MRPVFGQSSGWMLGFWFLGSDLLVSFSGVRARAGEASLAVGFSWVGPGIRLCDGQVLGESVWPFQFWSRFQV
jgi:hypothetical protein